MGMLDKLKSWFCKDKKQNTSIEEIDSNINYNKLPKSPIDLYGHYNQLYDPGNTSILNTKVFDHNKELLRWSKFPEQYCGYPSKKEKCVIVFKEKVFVTTTYLYWLLQNQLNHYNTSEEFWQHVAIYGAMNKRNFKTIINNYYHHK